MDSAAGLIWELIGELSKLLLPESRNREDFSINTDIIRFRG